jgi:hypothetical protein
MSPGARLLSASLASSLLFVVFLAGAIGAAGPAGAIDVPLSPHAVPDIVGPGSCVSSVGNVWIKTTNIGFMGNPFVQSPDPSAQWPGPSGVQYLGFWTLWVGAKNPEALDPSEARRVSAGGDWRPPSLAPEDRIYSSYEGQARGTRDFDDDADGRVDEEFLNGKDDDHDGNIDEDYAAISQQMCTCEMRDDTEQAIAAVGPERHVPFHLLVRQTTYAFAAVGANDFVAVDYRIQNDSGHQLDSVYVGFFVDPDIGPVADDRFYADDQADPRVPQGDYPEEVTASDPRYDAALCHEDTIRVNGFTYFDNDGDLGRTNGAGAFLLLGHTTDPSGIKAPRRVGFRMYRTYTPGTPFVQGGQPTVDVERYETISSTVGIDPLTGFISEERTDGGLNTDYRSICSVGPFLEWQHGEAISVQVAYAVQRCDYTRPLDDPRDSNRPDPARYANLVRAAIEAQKTFRGGPTRTTRDEPTPDQRGRETAVTAPPGQILELSDCRDPEGTTRTVDDTGPTWFDTDCNWCTGLPGFVDRHWIAAAPPPSPAIRLTPGPRRVTIEWDNRSETVPDPSSRLLDVKAYRIWKASNFTRPVGSSGPTDELWALLAEYKVYDLARPLVDSVDTDGDRHFDGTKETWPILLNVQTGARLEPLDVAPLMDPVTGDTLVGVGNRPYRDADGASRVWRDFRVPVYPVGRYRFEDTNVLNGFVYFYAVTAIDSTGQRDVNGGRGSLAQQEGGRSASERDGVTPQAAVAAGSGGDGVVVVPNPYRGRAQWDLLPSAADPSGSHIDFLGMPPGPWTLRIFTLAGDLVQSIRNSDTQVNGKPQQETPEDGQASWNLISRNGQDVASGIYLFSVEGATGTHQGKFVVIR